MPPEPTEMITHASLSQYSHKIQYTHSILRLRLVVQTAFGTEVGEDDVKGGGVSAISRHDVKIVAAIISTVRIINHYGSNLGVH